MVTPVSDRLTSRGYVYGGIYYVTSTSKYGFWVRLDDSGNGVSWDSLRRVSGPTTINGEEQMPRTEESSPSGTLHRFLYGGYVTAHRHPNGNGWVADSARVAATAYVSGEVSQNARVEGQARVIGCVFSNAVVRGGAVVNSGALVFNRAIVEGRAIIEDYARVFDHARVGGNAVVLEYSEIGGNARLETGRFSGLVTRDMRISRKTKRHAAMLEILKAGTL